MTKGCKEETSYYEKKNLILLGILIIGGGAAGVCWKTGVFGQQEVSGDVIYVTQISEINGEASGVSNRYAGVVEPQETVSVELENGRSAKEVKVKTGDQIKKGPAFYLNMISAVFRTAWRKHSWNWIVSRMKLPV